MINFDTPYPAQAQNAYWQKKKSVLDKIAKASRVTGLGEMLTAAEEKYNAIDFLLLEVRSAKGRGGNPHIFRTPEHIDQAKSNAQQHILEFIRPAREKMRLAAIEAETIQKNEGKLFNATTVAAATAVAKALREHEKRLMDIKLNDFDEAKQKMVLIAERTRRDFGDGLISALQKADTFIRDVTRTPTAETFNKYIGGASRGLTQMIANVAILESQGAGLQKGAPNKTILETLEPWANGGVTLPPISNREAVLEALGHYEDCVRQIRQWWG